MIDQSSNPPPDAEPPSRPPRQPDNPGHPPKRSHGTSCLVVVTHIPRPKLRRRSTRPPNRARFITRT